MAWVTSKCKARKLYFFARFVGIFSASKLMLVSKKLFSLVDSVSFRPYCFLRELLFPSAAQHFNVRVTEGKRDRELQFQVEAIWRSLLQTSMLYIRFSLHLQQGICIEILVFKKRTRGFFEGSKNVTLSRRFY